MKITVTLTAALLSIAADSAMAQGFFDPITKPVEKAVQDTGKTIEKAAQDTGKTVEKGVQDTGKTIEKTGQDVGNTVSKTAQDVGSNVEKGVQDTGKTIEKAAQDTGRAIGKAGDDTIAETGRALENLEDARQAFDHYVEREVNGIGNALSDANKRVLEGKYVDAIWHLGTDPIKNQEEYAAKAAQESSLIRTVGQVAASAYGGPGGAAAYAAWYTYRETNDPDLALRVGLIVGSTSAALNVVDYYMPTDTTGEVARKAVVAGAIGGLAVAASGGDEASIKEGFLLSGGMVLVQAEYEHETTHKIDAKASSDEEPYCMLSVGKECSPPDDAYIRDASGKIQYDSSTHTPLVDVRKTNPRINHVGEWAKVGDTGWTSERGTFMKGVSKMPVMNAMSVFHDTWAVGWNMSPLMTKATIPPAIYFVYLGADGPALEAVRKANVNAHARKASETTQTTKDNLPTELTTDNTGKTATKAKR